MMADIVCYTSDGRILNSYLQWSTNQKLIIKGADTSFAPVFNFSNTKYKTALLVQSDIIDNNLVASVPDILLQDIYPIIVHATYGFNTNSDFSVRIPIMPQAKPGDYVFDDSTGSGGSSGSSVQIANNLTTDSAVVALAAAQGVVLKSMIDNIESSIDVTDQINEALEAARESGDFDGRGIVSISHTDGNGAPGTIDTYTITYTDGTEFYFYVHNGKDGKDGMDGTDGEDSVVETIPSEQFNELQQRVDDIQAQIGDNPIAEQINIAIKNANHASLSYVDEKVSEIVDSAPDTLNTLKELATALGDDPNFATTIVTQIGGKVDKVDGKGLSTNDYTNEEKEKLNSIEAGATKIIVDSELNTESSNPIRNDVVSVAISNLDSKIGDKTVAEQIDGVFSDLEKTPLSIKQGGTGATNATTARSNLGLGSVSVESIVPISKGGTGASNASSARVNLELGSVSTENTVPIGKGGTGATDAATARNNIGAAPMYSYGTTDLTAGSSALETGKLYFVYE